MQAWAESFTLCFRAEEPLTLVVPSPNRSRNSLASRLCFVSSGWVRVTGMEKVSPSPAFS